MISKSLPGRKAHHLQRARQPVQLFRTQHRALVVDQRENRRPLAEIVAQLHLLAAIVSESQVQRQLRVQVLRNSHFVEQPRFGVGRPHLFIAVTGNLRRQQRRRQRADRKGENRRQSNRSPDCV